MLLLYWQYVGSVPSWKKHWILLRGTTQRRQQVAWLFPLVNYKGFSWSNRIFKQRQVHKQDAGCNFQFCSHALSKIWVVVTVQFVLNYFLPAVSNMQAPWWKLSGSSSWMTSSRVFWLIHGIEQRAGQAGTLATVRAGFGELGGGASECVGFFQRGCAGAQGRAACGAVGLQPSTWLLGVPSPEGQWGGAAGAGLQQGPGEGPLHRLLL